MFVIELKAQTCAQILCTNVFGIEFHKFQIK